jgi:hypothetical protein
MLGNSTIAKALELTWDSKLRSKLLSTLCENIINFAKNNNK